jgi:hypothetical protein
MEGLIHGGLLLNHNYHSDYRPKNRGRNFHLRICRAYKLSLRIEPAELSLLLLTLLTETLTIIGQE